MAMQQIAFAVLAAIAAGGVAWVFIYPLIAGRSQVDQRREALTRSDPKTRGKAGDGQRDGKKRREQVEGSLKEMELRQQRNKRPPLSLRLQQAGLKWTKQKFYLVSAGIAVVAAVVALVLSGSFLAAGLFAFVGGLGLPHWIVAFLKKRRQSRFIEIFPEAVDVIVRGIKTGLPLLDCIKMISTETPEPVCSEFRAIVERQAIGTPLGEACGMMYERTGLAEANFFGIVITIQTKAGGNLSEALGNLSKVLRERKKMRAKIQAMSMEAKASAGIIGSLPVIVGFLVYLTSPDYIMILFTDRVGIVLLLISAFWMSCGVFTMKKMINFDF